MIASNKMENILISMGLQVVSMIVTCILQQYSHNNIVFSIGFDLASHYFFFAVVWNVKSPGQYSFKHTGSETFILFSM